MAFTKITAAGIGTTESVTLDGLSVINNGSFGGNLTVSGVLTYEDVTNVDSVGLITARNGIVVGSGITLSKDGDIFATGVSTVTTLKVGSGVTVSSDGDVFFTGIATGNGSGLTALNATQLTSGTVPTARLGSGTASSSTFLRGDSTFQTVNTDLVSDTSPQLGGDLASNGNDIIFADNDKAIFGTGSDLKIYHNGTHNYFLNSNGDYVFDTGSSELARITSAGNLGLGYNSPSQRLVVHAGSDNSDVAVFTGGDVARGLKITTSAASGPVNDGVVTLNAQTSSVGEIAFATYGTERVRITSSGHFGVGLTPADSFSFGKAIDAGSTSGAFYYARDTDGGSDAVGGFGYSGSGLYIGNEKSDGFIRFSTNTSATERMRIDSAGSVLIGATSYGGGGADPIFYVSGTSGRLVKIHNTSSATTSLQLTNAATGQGEDQGMQLAALANGECGLFNAEAERILIQSQEADNNKPVVNFMKPQGPSNATTVMIAFETGNQGRGAVLSSSSDGGSPSFTNLSDYRIKTNIRNYTDGYNNIKAMPVKLFDMTSDGTKDIKGWIAHEVQDYIPEAVMGDKDAVDSNGKPIYQQLSYGLFMPDVVSALQTAIAKIEVLETRLNNAGIAT